ncbi:MAG: hypothetical protein QOF76_3932 [Solirubrobacteraceae bacterium]|jgi:hypothetical protein|nr:hypothetical protein [Solirubrobacteraceae bacterium]
MSITIPDVTAANTITNGVDTLEIVGRTYTIYTLDLGGQIALGTYTNPAEALAALDATDRS